MEQIRIPLTNLENTSNDISPKIASCSIKNKAESCQHEKTQKTVVSAIVQAVPQQSKNIPMEDEELDTLLFAKKMLRRGKTSLSFQIKMSPILA